MASPLDVQLILCDAAQADPHTGKVHMLGAGWSTTRAPVAHAVAVLAKVPWDRANQKIPLVLELHDQDGHQVTFPTSTGPEPVRAEAEIEVGRPAGLLPGSDLDASFALNIAPLPLAPGRYRWHLTVAEEKRSAAFTVFS